MNLMTILFLQQTASEAETAGEKVGYVLFYIILIVGIIFLLYKMTKKKK